MSRQGSIHRDTPIFEYFGMCNVLDENSIFVTFSLMQVFRLDICCNFSEITDFTKMGEECWKYAPRTRPWCDPKDRMDM